MVSATPDKQTLRRELMRQRQAQSAGEVEYRSQRVFQTFLAAADELLPASYERVGLYFPIRGEVDTRPFFKFFRSRRKAALFPVTEGERISFHEVRDWSELQTGNLGIAEPRPRPGVPAAEPDVVLVPGVAFSRHAHRLGFGGGFYDRAIHAWEAAGRVPRLIALAYDFQLVDVLPNEDHDRAMDFITLESQVLKREGRKT